MPSGRAQLCGEGPRYFNALGDIFFKVDDFFFHACICLFPGKNLPNLKAQRCQPLLEVIVQYHGDASALAVLDIGQFQRQNFKLQGPLPNLDGAFGDTLFKGRVGLLQGLLGLFKAVAVSGGNSDRF